MRISGKQYVIATLAIPLLVFGMQTAVLAIDMGDALAIHGFGHQGYLQSNANNYLGADGHGSWDYNMMALVLTAKVDDNTKIWLELHSTAAETRLDWAFVDYQFTPDLVGRAGEIKLPFGLYNEIIDAHFLQQSTLPPILYQDAGIRYESFRGIAASYKQGTGSGALSWDMYAGQVLDPEQAGTTKFGRLLGGRATYQTPVDGLRLMASAFGSNEENTDFASPGFGDMTRQKTSALSVDYVANNWDVKAEAALNKEFGIVSNTSYIQTGYTLAEKWTPFARYDYIITDKAQKSDPSYYQKTATVGLNYKINSNVSVRVEDHVNRGYAMPVKTYVAPGGPDTAIGVAAGAGRKDWNLLAASVNFIF